MSSVRQLTQLTAIGIATLQLRTELEHRSICDPLTELFNRSFMQSSLERELARAKRNGQASLAVLMLDVDHFKKFNDQFGHSAGDDVLKQVAGLFRRFTRAEDILCRYGGEEFTIIMPDITTQAAVARGERLRQEVAQLSQQPSNQKFELISISVGIALYPQDGTSSVELLCRADEALYRAKRAGRDRVMLSAPKSLSMEVALID
jgi:diguanylate cyclase (GGDEF)-like protein